MNPQVTTLSKLPASFRILYTGFLLVIGVGLLMAGFQIMETHGKADGKPGLSINDIVYSYYGNRSGSKLESMLKGQMKPMAPDEARFKIIQWARDESNPIAWTQEIKPIFDQYCVGCHAPGASIPDFTQYENVKKVAAVDEGASIASLTRVSHIHLFGISFIFLFVGWIFALAQYPLRWKLILISTPFVFLLMDVLSWWLTKYHPIFAWLTMIGGLGYSVASTVMITTSLAQMWLPEVQWPEHWRKSKAS